MTTDTAVTAASTSRRGLVSARVLFALLGFSAVVTEIATLVARGRFRPDDFFSYFTIEANSLTVICLLLSAFALASGRSSRGLELFRGAVTLYMTTTILIFIVLLSGFPSSTLTAVPWDNTVLHYIMPIAVILDWVLGERVAPIAYRTALLWLAFPLLYLVYSLVRGPLADWYPYPFMDPSENGYAAVLITSVVIAVILAGITAVIARVPSWRAARTAR